MADDDRNLRDRMRPKARIARAHAHSRAEDDAPHVHDETCRADADIEFTVGFIEDPERRCVGVFLGDPTDEDSPLFAIPIEGELTKERKDLIANKVLDIIHTCLDPDLTIGLDVVKVGPTKVGKSD